MGPDRRYRLAVLAGQLAARRGIELPGGLALFQPVLRAPTQPLAEEAHAELDGAGPEALGALLESMLGDEERRRQGAWYTPPELAARTVGWALDASSVHLPTVCDPACGGGVFLLAAAETLAARGHRRSDVVRHLVAIDVEPLAVAVTEAALCIWAGGDAVPRTMVGDALLDPWPIEHPDVVVGNPPFLGQLATATARPRERIQAVTQALGPSAAGYVDEAVLFLLAAARRSPVVAMVQPQSTVVTASGSLARAELADRLDRVWVAPVRLFEADVRVCVVVLADRARVEWEGAVADARGIPAVMLRGTTRLGDVARVSAGFRDEYYGLVPLVRERDGIPLITSGLLDPNRCRWGEVPARFGRQRWEAPAIDPIGLAVSPLAAWSAGQLVPKVLVATQTKVLEAAADVDGAWLPCTPVLTVVPELARLWHVLAAVLAPAASAWAMWTAGGSALSVDAVKLSATQLRTLPLPDEGPAWDAAATALAAGDLLAAGAAMDQAYGVDLFDWWAARLPFRP